MLDSDNHGGIQNNHRESEAGFSAVRGQTSQQTGGSESSCFRCPQSVRRRRHIHYGLRRGISYRVSIVDVDCSLSHCVGSSVPFVQIQRTDQVVIPPSSSPCILRLAATYVCRLGLILKQGFVALCAVGFLPQPPDPQACSTKNSQSATADFLSAGPPRTLVERKMRSAKPGGILGLPLNLAAGALALGGRRGMQCGYSDRNRSKNWCALQKLEFSG